MKKILYVGRMGIPNNAPGIRVYNIAKILREIGYEIIFFSDITRNKNENTNIEYDHFQYYYNPPVELKGKILSMYNIYQLLTAQTIFMRIKKYCENTKPYAIILYNDLYPLTKKLIPYCKGKGIKLIVDATEWYEKVQSKNAVEKVIPFFTDRRIKFLDQKVGNVIAISRYFYDYYNSLNCNVIEIPPVFDITSKISIKKFNYYKNYTINLVYAGSPGASKDMLGPVLDAVYHINQTEMRVRFDIVGVDEQYISRIWRDIDFKKYAIMIHGKLSHEMTLKIVKNADFGVLLRSDKRYAKAGFSTKFSECMSNGVSMLCNSIGGTDKLITNMVNGVVIENTNTDTVMKALQKLISLDESDILNIRTAAYDKACKIFNRSFYNDKLKEFMENLK